MGRKSLKEVRQKEIIRVFYRLAKKEGLENTSIARIAKEMDINPSLIIHYFQTREDLTYGLIDYILEKYKLIFRTKSKGDSKPLLSELIDNLFSNQWNRLFDDSLFYRCYALTFHDARSRKMYKLLLDSLRENLTVILTRCNEEGVIRIEDPEKVADQFFAILDGAYFYLSLVEDEKEYEIKLEQYKSLAYTLLGIFPSREEFAENDGSTDSKPNGINHQIGAV